VLSLSTGSFGRFVLVGVVNTAVAYGGFPVLYLTIGDKVGYFPIIVFCSVFNPLFSFVTHKFVTFASTETAGREFLRYLPFNIGVFFVSWAFLHLIRNWRPVQFALAQVLFNVAVTIASFFVARKFVFRYGLPT
jgi:putative flippase GtrA